MRETVVHILIGIPIPIPNLVSLAIATGDEERGKEGEERKERRSE